MRGFVWFLIIGCLLMVVSEIAPHPLRAILGALGAIIMAAPGLVLLGLFLVFADFSQNYNNKR